MNNVAMKTNVNIYSDGENPVIEWNGEVESDDNYDLTSQLDNALNDMENIIKKQ